ncbi:hypothetical protein [Cetobacterium sp.]|uniref:hypothetical protein n=1 Tax=Cetobacterium sp. TaxID=2071632 RepID=UPI003EE73D53
MYNYKWEKEFEENLKENSKNITILRDFPITEIEFQKMIAIINFDLKSEYLHDKKESFLLARFLVEIGYREYDEKMFWDFVFKALHLNKLPKYQMAMSELFYKTLKRNNLFHMKTGKKYVGSILINTYVPKNYLENFYKFLQNFYIRELSQTFDSDLILETIDELQNYLENEDKNKVKQTSLNDKPSTFYLLSTVKKSIYLNKESFKEYLYNYLEVLDSYWWNTPEKKELKFKEEEAIFFEWFNRGANVKERKLVKKLEKQYKSPTITLGMNNNLNLYIPRQKIMHIDEYKGFIFYKIKLNGEIIQKGKLSAFSSFDKVMIEQEKISLSDFYYNADLIIESMGIELKKFKLFENPFIIFNQNNEKISPISLKNNIDYKIYSNKEILLIDEDQEIYLKPEVNIFTYNENNNYRIIDNDKEYFLGKVPQFKILDNKENYFNLKENDSISVYKEFPRIFIKTDMDSSMIRIDLNDKKYKLLELKGSYKEDNEGFLLDLKKIFFKNYGKIAIKIIELQGNKEIFKEDIFILNFELKFDKKEYFFEKEALIFIDKKQDISIEHNYKYSNENSEIKIPLINNSNIRFKIKETILNCKIPVLKWRSKNSQQWKYENLMFWHEDFKDEIEIYIPNAKIAKIQLGNYKVIESQKLKNTFVFDLNKFLDEFRINEQNFYDIRLLFDDKEIVLGKVIYKNHIKNIGIGYQKNAQKILGQFEIYGKGDYFIDIIDKKNQNKRIWSKIIKEVVINELININYPLDYNNYAIKIGYYEDKKNKFFGNKERSEKILYESKLYEIEAEEKIEDRLYRENIIQVYKCISNQKSYYIKSFYIKNIEKINENLYKGQAFYTLKDGSLRYFSHNNPFEFKIDKIDKEDGIISELLDNNGEIPILDSYYKRLKTDEPQEDKNNYERWLIPDEYRFKIVGGE